MSARTKRRAAERTRLAAQICKVPLSTWTGLSRRERRRRPNLARKDPARG